MKYIKHQIVIHICESFFFFIVALICPYHTSSAVVLFVLVLPKTIIFLIKSIYCTLYKAL